MNRKINSRHHQKGLSTPSWIAIAGLFGLMLVSFLTVFPMYYGNFKVRGVLDAMQQDTELDVKSKRAIWTSLSKRLYIDEVRTIQKENVKISRKNGKTTITVSYETRDDWVGNLFIGGRFVETVVIDR